MNPPFYIVLKLDDGDTVVALKTTLSKANHAFRGCEFGAIYKVESKDGEFLEPEVVKERTGEME